MSTLIHSWTSRILHFALRRSNKHYGIKVQDKYFEHGPSTVTENNAVTILGLHVTSPKIKLRNYRFFWVLLSRGITVPKHLYINKFLVRKGPSFCARGRLNFQAFAWRDIKLAAGKALMLVKNITDFGRFCNLNIPCVRINITVIFMSSSSEEFTH